MTTPARTRVAFVIHRYGAGIDGGAEALCRAVAERLAVTHDLEVLTTTATDYLTWANALAEGVTEEGGVKVRRFRVANRRRVRSFGRLSNRLYATEHTLEDELDWMVRQGPRSLDLVRWIRDHRESYDAFVFFTYLYYTTHFGLGLVGEKSVLVPTVHDEPPARFGIFRSTFRLPRAFVWNTPEERAFAVERFAVAGDDPIAGYGVDPVVAPVGPSFAERHGIGDYLLCMGRIDVWKGIPELLEHFAHLRESGRRDLTLVLLGNQKMRLGRQEGVLAPGFVSEEEKFAALAGARATVLPSPYESLSLVALESWALGTPVLASARSEVLAGQIARSGGGVPYEGREGFVAAVEQVGRERDALGEAGRRFVAETCTWDRVLDVYRRAIARAAGSPS